MSQVTDITMRYYCDMMRFSSNTLHVLRVFSDEFQPLGRGIMRIKEGL